MSSPKRLERGRIYHIYNRGNNREELFTDPASYDYFELLVKRHILPIADIYCYCLLRNHFHLLVRVLQRSEIGRAAHPSLRSVSPSQQFGNCFNAFAKATNAARGRTGSLFQRPFGRRVVFTRDYFKKLVLYVHMNPQAHGIVQRFDHWRHSSYPAYTEGADSYLKKATVVGLFGGPEDFVNWHESESESRAKVLEGVAGSDREAGGADNGAGGADNGSSVKSDYLTLSTAAPSISPDRS